MKLKNYLQLRKKALGKSGSARQFAVILGITEDHLSKVALGKRNPSFRLLQRIVENSEGIVQLSDFAPS